MKPILIFDYDGTLHETMKIYEPAVYDTVEWLKNSCAVSVEVPGRERIQSWLGLNTSDMWNDFLPELKMDMKKRAAMRIGDRMQEALEAGRGGWYDGVSEMLDRLRSQGFTMAVLSNCGVSYGRLHWERFGMERWFTAFFPCECWNNAPKSEIMKDIVRDFRGAVEKTPLRRDEVEGVCEEVRDGKTKFVVIGDRDSDFEGARAVGAPFIGCTYGYGTPDELRGDFAAADRPADIAEILRNF